MAETAPKPPGPTEHHERLLKKVGEWRVSCKYYMSPTEPIEAVGSDHVDSIGSFWTTGQFSCDVMGNVIRGLATTGYDPKKKKYVGTWQDSATPYFYYFEGNFTDDDTLEMEGENVDPISGKLVKYKSVEKLGDDQRTLELTIHPDDGKPIRILEYSYERV